MLSKSENKLIATQTGIGQILDENIDRSNAKVVYNLNIFQEVRIYTIRDLSEEVEGLTSIKGNITVLDNRSLYRYNNPVLQLQDGRRISIDIMRATDLVNNRYEIGIVDACTWTE